MGDVIKLVLNEVVTLALIGVAVGVAGALALTDYFDVAVWRNCGDAATFAWFRLA